MLGTALTERICHILSALTAGAVTRIESAPSHSECWCATADFFGSALAAHYVTWSEQERIESHGPEYLRNAVRIITETGLRVYKELTPMRREQVDLQNAVVWIPDSKTPSGRAEVPLTSLAVEAFQGQIAMAANSAFLFPSDRTPHRPHTRSNRVWSGTLRRARIP